MEKREEGEGEGQEEGGSDTDGVSSHRDGVSSQEWRVDRLNPPSPLQQLNIAGNANGQTALGSCPTCAKVREREMGKGVGGEDREMRHTRSVYACFILDMDSCV